ncbi:MAG: hypothetical protein KDD94_05475, partial [Calditrichaeota bacterium]|nr:hypothetical protein [Calditrichota bacterium]
ILTEALDKNLDNKKQKPMLKSIKENVSIAQETMSDIIWSISPKNDNWQDLVKRMQDFASDTLASQSIKFSLNTANFNFDTPLKMEKRQHLWRIYKEIITNIARHSHCKTATIDLFNEDNKITLAIEDDGQGYDNSVLHNGNGLTNINSRSQQLNATVTNSSSPNGGCRWLISFSN